MSPGVMGRGIAGPCNLCVACFYLDRDTNCSGIRTDGEFESTVDSIVTATQRALKSLNDTVNGNGTTNEPCHGPVAGLEDTFFSVWIATAGIDRAGLRERVMTTVSQRLRLDQSVDVRITNDVDLLAVAMTRHSEVSSSIVVIAGTGSIAIRYLRDSNEPTPSRIARSGGWGHLLDDEGAEYALGREAICQVLSAIEDMSWTGEHQPLVG